MTKRKKVLVLYSGGRDSSAAAITMAKLKHRVTLFTFQAGLPELTGHSGDSAPDIRHKELICAFKEINSTRIIEGNPYLIRKLGIERTNTEHVVYPITLALAVHCAAIRCCKLNNFKKVVSGYSGYQSCRDIYIEQSPHFVKLTEEFLGEYDIEYETPVVTKSEGEIKDILERDGISSNSLENKSLFGGVSFEPKFAEQYWKSCIPFCKKYLAEVL